MNQPAMVPKEGLRTLLSMAVEMMQSCAVSEGESGGLGVRTLAGLLPSLLGSGRLLHINAIFSDFLLFSLYSEQSSLCLCRPHFAASSGYTLLSLEGKKLNSGFHVTVDCTELEGRAHSPSKFLLCL